MNGINAESELGYIYSFVDEGSFDEELARDQLRVLWTSFCLHQDIDVDTYQYDAILVCMYNYMDLDEMTDTADWSDYESFNNYMSKYLV